MITAGGVIAALVGLLTIGSAILAMGRWVGRREAQSRLEDDRAGRIDRALEMLPKIETKVEQIERSFDRHLSDHKQLAARVEDTRDKVHSFHGDD